MDSRSLSRIYLYLFVVICMGASLASCGQPSLPPMQVQRDPLQSWIEQHAIPFKTTDAQAPLDDLASLQRIAGQASIVGLGEATHGSHEFFTMKQRVLEFLVEKMGFTMFAMEASWSAGEQINHYVLTGRGDARKLLQQFHEWVWSTQEVLNLIQWMRAYDADPRHIQKVRFAGFDCQDIETITFDNVERYVQSVAPQQVAQVAALYTGIRPDPTQNWDSYMHAYNSAPPAIRQQYVDRAENVYALLNAHQAQYEKASSPQAFALALQEAHIIVEYTQFMVLLNDPKAQSRAIQQRDIFMADNIAWLHEHSDGGEKIALWAHDGHIGVWTYEGGYTIMGKFLRQRYHKQYLAIGTSFYQGMFNAYGKKLGDPVARLQAFTMPPPSKDSYNYILGHAGIPLYILDLRRPPPGAVSRWLKGPFEFRLAGIGFNDADESQFYDTIGLGAYFDVLIHIQQVTASHLIDY